MTPHENVPEIGLEQSTKIEKNKEQELFEYGENNYDIYRKRPPFMSKVFYERSDTDNGFRKELEKIKYFKRIERFLDNGGNDDEIQNIFNRRGFNFIKVRESIMAQKGASEKNKLNKLVFEINKVIVKDNSFFEAVEKQSSKGLILKGFDSDKDFHKIEKTLANVFSKKILDECLISEIDYHPEIVYIRVDGTDFWLTLEKYQEWKKVMPDIRDYKFRAESFSSWNKINYRFTAFPIFMYSFIDEDLSQFNYLEGLPDDEKIKIYKIGTVAHEIGHSIYSNLMDTNMLKEWKELIDERSHPLTAYSDKYASGTFGSSISHGEEFAEAIRLKTTRPEFLEKDFPEIFNFIESKFSEIKNMNIDTNKNSHNS